MFSSIRQAFAQRPALRLFALVAAIIVGVLLIMHFVVKKTTPPAPDTTSGGFDVPSGTDTSVTGTLVPLAPVTVINNIPPTTPPPTTGGGGGIVIPPPQMGGKLPDPIPANGMTLPQIGAKVGKSPDSLYKDPRNAKVRSYILSRNPRGGTANNNVPIPSGYSLYY